MVIERSTVKEYADGYSNFFVTAWANFDSSLYPSSSGYYKSGENAFTADGWFRSGDLGERRGENIAITGRTKDVINRGGGKLNPAEVEQLLDAHPKVQQSAIVPMPDPILGEKAHG